MEDVAIGGWFRIPYSFADFIMVMVMVILGRLYLLTYTITCRNTKLISPEQRN